MRGRIDGMTGEMLRAWAWDPARPRERLLALLVIDGYKSDIVVGDQPRQDLAGAGIGDGAHGIRYTVPGHLCTEATREVSLQVVDADGGMVEVDRRLISFTRQNAWLAGRVEGFRRGRCTGWAWDQRDGTRRLKVQAVWKGEVVATELADRERKDLLSAGIGDGAHAFEIALPPSVWQAPDPNEVLTIQTADGQEIGTIRLPENDLLKSLVDLGRQAEREGDHATAIKNLEEALRLSPDNVDALWVRARIAAGQGDTEKARALATQAFDLHPSHARAVVILGRLAHNEGNYEEALGYWQQVQPGDSAFRESLIKAGRALMRLGRPVEVLAPVRRALSLNPDDIDAHRLLADAHLAIGSVALAAKHLRALAAAQPADRKIAGQLQKVTGVEPRKSAPLSLEFLENPTMHDWQGPGEGAVTAPSERANGVVLRPAERRGSVSFLVSEPQEFRAGELPHYGLRVTGSGTAAELAFRFRKDVAPLLMTGLRLYVETRAAGDGTPAPMDVQLLVRVGGRDVRRTLLSCQARKRAKMEAFDLVLTDAEAAALEAGDAWLVLRVAAGRAALLRAPRPLLKIEPEQPRTTGYEGPPLPDLSRFGIAAAGARA
jgi:Flp pilus assembly protein TadD